jgi:hypothetical protein
MYTWEVSKNPLYPLYPLVNGSDVEALDGDWLGASFVSTMVHPVALDFEVMINPLFADPFAPNRPVAPCSSDCVSCQPQNLCGLRCRIPFLDSHGGLYANAYGIDARRILMAKIGREMAQIQSVWFLGVFGRFEAVLVSSLRSSLAINFRTRDCEIISKKGVKIRYPRRVSQNWRKQSENSIKIVDDAILLFGIRPKTSI